MPRSMTPEEYQELGRRYYKLKQFDKALQTFNEAIDASPTLSLYDHRAACHDKLGEHKAAVEDGRTMIKLDKQNVRGYLRTASILEKMELPERALGIYKYGMKHVPVEDENFKLLQQLHDRLTRTLSPAKAVDPFTVLPVEVAEMVLEYLAFHQMVGCMRVSRGWRDYLQKLPRQWRHLDLSAARRPVSRRFVDSAVRRSQYRLERLTLHRFRHMDVVQNVARACKNLTELTIWTLPPHTAQSLVAIVQACPSLQKLVVHADTTADTASQIFDHGKHLSHIELHAFQQFQRAPHWAGPFPRLTHLRLVSSQPHTNLNALVAQTPALHSLVLSNPYDARLDLAHLPLTTLVLHSTQFLARPSFPPTLTRLTLDLPPPSGLTTWDLGAPALPHLTHLTLTNAAALDATFFPALLDAHVPPGSTVPVPVHGAPLTHLSLSGTLAPGTPLLGPRGLLSSSPRLLTPHLTSLTLLDLPATDDDVDALLTHPLSALQEINVSGSRVSGAGVKALVEGLKGLNRVCVGSAVRGREVVEWARGRGVGVVLGGEGEGRGGRRVRG
ncbi:hypothetical protein C7974DRAFT_352443 [Boeremia exigua]|uniref:uncharacterized protein n=1 Tax=Boeremia exigua TaxID=749465 RepID=UPI001E8ECC95|nr:uncharacterized protein C7974DRAFT_352443 [Boeremia exigua]KAH6643171.1 hypothetical protein C7974DRAFT_352443 [Boeremia exigua]